MPEQQTRWALLLWVFYVGFVLFYGDGYDQAVPEVMADGEVEDHGKAAGADRYGFLLVGFLLALKVLGVWLAHGLVQSDAAVTDASLDSAILPLVALMLDHAVDTLA